MTLRPHSVVHSIIYDEQKRKGKGVRVIDAQTKEATEYFAKIIFVNAAAINTNLVLLNSTSNDFPMDWEMIVVCWENIWRFIITGQA